MQRRPKKVRVPWSDHVLTSRYGKPVQRRTTASRMKK